MRADDRGVAMSFLDLLRGAGFDFYTGVPDSTFKSLLRELETWPDYVAAVSENVAIGLAAGAWLGGRRPVVFMQNTGLALAMNPLASLAAVYRIPLLLVVGWRGHDGNDSPEHEVIGPATLPLLRAVGLPFRVPDAGSVARELAAAVAEMEARALPCAIVCRPGVLE
jgi:sulfopyruvate decarboxylase TPP-binding subunit